MVENQSRLRGIWNAVRGRAHVIHPDRGSSGSLFSTVTFDAALTDDWVLNTYQDHPWMHSSLRVLAALASAVPWRVRRRIPESDGTTRTEIVNDHPIPALIANPNEHWTQHELIGYTIMYQVLCGKAHWLVEGEGADSEETTIWLPHPQHMTPVLDRKRWISGWEFRTSKGETVLYSVEEIMTVWELNPGKDQDSQGIAPAKAMRTSLRLDQMLQRFHHQALKLGTRLRLWLSTEETMDDVQKKQVENEIKLIMGGPENVDRMYVAQGTMKVNESVHASQDADYPGLTQQQIQIQSAMVGVPPVFQGRTEGVTYNQAEKQEVVFWMLLDVLHLQPIAKAATKFFHARGWLADDEELFADTAPQRNAAPAVAQRALAQGRAQNVMSINEARATFWNLHPIAGGDVIVTNTGLIVLPDGTMTSVNALSVKPDGENKEETPPEETPAREVPEVPERMEDLIQYVRGMDPERRAWVRAWNERAVNPKRTLTEIHTTQLNTLARKVQAEVASGQYVVDRLVDWPTVRAGWVSAVQPTWRAAWEDNYNATLKTVGARAMVLAGGNGHKHVYRRDLEESITKIVDAMAGLVDETLASLKDDIRDVITSGLGQGLDAHEIARGLADIDGFQGILEGDGAKLTRALKIATTELTGIAGDATLAGFRESGAVKTKEWINTSGNPRPSHAAMNGETVGIDESFSNGGQYPGDASLSADERVNCLCVLGVGELAA